MAAPDCCVYEIFRLSTGERYIGSTTDLIRRRAQHTAGLNAGNHHCSKLQDAWIKDGPDGFLFSVIERCKPADLAEKEQWRILACDALLNSSTNVVSPRLGVPVRAISRERMRAAHLGKLRTAESRKKQSETRRSKSPPRGWFLSSEHRQAIGIASRLAQARPDVKRRQRDGTSRAWALRGRDALRLAAFWQECC